MKLALCMIVKDEINRIAGCLEPIIDLLDEVIITDTGSTDGTPELLRRRFGIELLPSVMQGQRDYSTSVLRNQCYAQAQTPWILSLDADERLVPETLERFARIADDPATDGYFGRWENHLEQQPPFEDYKLFLFRRGFQDRGLIHSTVQPDLRIKGGRAQWLGGWTVDHWPEGRKQAAKTALYRHRLRWAIQQEPDWHRYYWFMGYMDFLAGDWPAATEWLNVVINAQSPLFPVECLNSYMVLADIYARHEQAALTCQCLQAGWRFYQQVADDFEVAVNFRWPQWWQQALEDSAQGHCSAIRAYRFAC